jgi:cystathionine gamma-lyase
MGVVVEDCPTRDYAAKDLAAYRLVYLETPSNPGLEVCDIAAIAKRAHVCGALVVADNTTLTPLGQRPLDLGADIVVSSDTKTINGHSDAMFGHVGTRDSDIAAKIREWRTLTGAIPGQLEAWLVQRGLETLEVRFDRMCASAGVIAERLSAHPAVTAVRYPGLTGDPGHSIAKAQMIRFGSLIGLTLASGDAAERFINTARFIIPATSFGGVLTSGERRARWGDQVDPGFVRLSIGCEPVEALWADMASALGGL